MNGTTITPDSLAINPVVNTIYGASSGTSLGFQFTSNAGSQNIFPGGYVFGAGKPIAVAANPASGVSYTLLATYDPSQTAGPILAVSESGAGYGTYGDVCYLNQIGQSSLSTPLAMDVNRATNSVFVLQRWQYRRCSGRERLLFWKHSGDTEHRRLSRQLCGPLFRGGCESDHEYDICCG